MKAEKWTYIERGEDELEINVEFEVTPFVPAQTYGPAENCYPAEGGEIEIFAVFHNGVAIDPPLTDDEEAKVIEHLQNALADGDFDDERDDDYLRDDRIDDDLTSRGASHE